MPHPAVSANRLTKSFGQRQAVSSLTFTVQPGRAFGLLGPNGSGKTTTIRLLNGLLTPNLGTVTLFGEQMNPANADALRQRVGVQTDTNLYDVLSAKENLQIWGSLYGLNRQQLQKRVDEVLETFDLTQRADSPVGEFSKGMRQKLAIGRAIIHEPELLFLDEPTAGLDPKAAADLIEYLKQMIKTGNTTLVISTHQLAGLEVLCDDIGIIKQGQLLTAGSVNDLLKDQWPGHRYNMSIEGDHQKARATVSPFATVQEATDHHLTFHTTEEQHVSKIIAALVNEGIAIRSVIPMSPTIEEFYFATLNKEIAA